MDRLHQLGERFEDRTGLSLGSESALVLYLAAFLIFNFAGVSLLSPSAWAPYVSTSSNSNAPAGSVWIENNELRWADGSVEYALNDLYTVTTSPGGSSGAAWIEGNEFHLIDANTDEKGFMAPKFDTTYYWYDTSTYQSNNGHPTTTSGFNEFFDTSNSGVSFGGSGQYEDRVYWHSSQWDAKPAYLPADGYSWKMEGYIWASSSGTYDFAVDSDDMSDVWIDGEVVANYPGGHGVCGCWSHSGSISLDKGWHRIKVRMEEGNGGDGVGLAWQKPGDSSWSVVPASEFSDGAFSAPSGAMWLENRYIHYIDSSGVERVLSSATGPRYQDSGPSGLFSASSITSDSGVTVDNPRVESLYSTGSGGNEVATFDYSGGYSDKLVLSYEQVSLNPSDGVDDRHHIILEARNGNGNVMFSVHLPDSDIHVFDAQNTNPDYGTVRSNSYDTGIGSSGTHEFELTYDGSDWSINIDNGAYTRTFSGITGEIHSLQFSGQGTSNSYLEGSHEFHMEDKK